MASALFIPAPEWGCFPHILGEAACEIFYTKYIKFFRQEEKAPEPSQIMRLNPVISYPEKRLDISHESILVDLKYEISDLTFHSTHLLLPFYP